MAQITEPGKIPPPEERLYAGMMGSVAIPISLFWFGWTSRASVHWIVPILSGVPFGWGLILIFVRDSMTYHEKKANSSVKVLGQLLPSRFVPSTQCCICHCSKRHTTLYIRRRFPALYPADVQYSWSGLGEQSFGFHLAGLDANPLGLLQVGPTTTHTERI